jgi:tRNA threonylcarbamoyladenosine biosynthesis protein TsaB
MNLLAIDTALEACSVGVSGGGRPVFFSEIIGRGHAERLMGMVTEAMAEARVAFPGLERIAVTIGPGSFTGVRVGIAAARGLALVIGCPVVGIGTLAVHADIAREIVGAKPVLVALDARRGEVYAQSFDRAGAALGPAEVGPPSDFAARTGDEVLLAGSGAALIAAAMDTDAASRIVHTRSAPDIATLLRLGMAAGAPFAPPRPLYIRAPDAKPQAAAAVPRR